MPGYIFDNDQIRALLAQAEIGDPGPGSPLKLLPETGGPLHADDPRFSDLAAQCVLQRDGDDWRVNLLLRAVLGACAQPEEVISVGVDAESHPGYALVRRGELWSECTVGRDGATKLYFPLSRSTAILSLIGALSGDAPEPPPSGFRFVGPAEDAFVLAAVLRAYREYPPDIAFSRLAGAVAEAAKMPAFAAAFTTVAGPEPIERLAASPEAVEASIGRLVVAKHLRNHSGTIRPSSVAEAVLGELPSARFGVTRTVMDDGRAASHNIQVTKIGDRKAVFRIRSADGRAPQFEWVEMNRQQIRAMIAALLLPEEAWQPEAAASSVDAPPRPATPVFPNPDCGENLSAGMKFCTSCGTRITSAATP